MTIGFSPKIFMLEFEAPAVLLLALAASAACASLARFAPLPWRFRESARQLRYHVQFCSSAPGPKN